MILLFALLYVYLFRSLGMKIQKCNIFALCLSVHSPPFKKGQ